jgi:hypothetical protein
MATIPRLLTVAEVAALAGRLEGRACSPRQVRYLLVTGRLGNDVQRRTQGQTRLYNVVDLAFVRLALRLSREGVSAVVARVVLTYLRSDLVRAWKAGAPLAVAIQGVQGSIEPALKTRPTWVRAWVPLREIWSGLDKQVEETCSARATVWMWRKVAVHAVRTS